MEVVDVFGVGVVDVVWRDVVVDSGFEKSGCGVSRLGGGSGWFMKSESDLGRLKVLLLLSVFVFVFVFVFDGGARDGFMLCKYIEVVDAGLDQWGNLECWTKRFR